MGSRTVAYAKHAGRCEATLPASWSHDFFLAAICHWCQRLPSSFDAGLGKQVRKKVGSVGTCQPMRLTRWNRIWAKCIHQPTLLRWGLSMANTLLEQLLKEQAPNI